MTRTTKTTLTLLGLLGLCLVTSTASAGPFFASARLMPTQVGYEIGAEGTAKVSRSIAEHFIVEILANLKDGTVLIVSATAKSGETFDIGSISMLLGSGRLELDSIRNGTSPAFPVQELESVTVSYKGEPALMGKFESGSNRFVPESEIQESSPYRTIQMK